MGATNIHVEMPKKHFKTIQEAFNSAREEATNEYGNDPYNGTISTCSLSGRINPPKDDEEYELALDKIDKRECVVYETKTHFTFIGWASC